MKRVEVTLVNLAPNVNADEKGNECPFVVERALSSCTTAQTMLQRSRKSIVATFFSKNKQDDKQLSGKLVKDVMRFVQVKDKYTALTSLLLKSQAFYETHPTLIQEQQEKTLPLVDLPRTEKGKPFVPARASALEQESDCYPISVSHQFPYCGLARLVVDDYDSESNCVDTKLGMDIVVFESLRTDLYESAHDFLQVFRDSFTEWEWQQILIHASSTDEEPLIEFYLRWAIKEAYTKALGLGLHLEFGKFETRLDMVDKSEHDASKSIWSAISDAREGIHLRGHVNMNGQETDWEFYFLPLCENEGKGENEEASGCLCICLGPLDDTDTSSSGNAASFEAHVTWTTLVNVNKWHNERKNI